MTWLDRLLALLLLLPAAWFALPPVLAGQLEPELSASGWWTLLQILPALVLLARPPRPGARVATVLSLFVAASLLSAQVLSPTDSLSASRSTMTAIAGLGALMAGSALGVSGRRWLAIGLSVVSLAYAAPALAGASARFQGALLNSGATSEAALLGALGALALVGARSPALRTLALAAIAAYGAFVARAPVLAGALGFLAVGGFAWMRMREERRSVALGMSVFVLAGAIAFGVGRITRDTEPALATGAPGAEATADAGHLGGFAVRLRIAPRALALFADNALLGVGPGQFRARFPEYRDPDERERSNRAAGAGVETEVEHAHDDVLTVLVEAGVLGGLAWILALAWIAVHAVRALTSGDPARAALGLATLGTLCNALLRAPLTFDPASASLFFAAAGALIARDDLALERASVRRFVPLLLVALLAVQAPRAWRLVEHGRAMRVPDGLDTAAALAACPDSPLALALSARAQASDPARLEDARASWERVLRLRPWNFEALVQSGVLAAKAGDVEAARSAWSRARQLAPERRGLYVNSLLLEARHGGDADFDRAAERAAGRVEASWALVAGANAALEGDERAALRLWRFGRAPWLAETADQWYERSRAEAGEATAVQNALEALAHVRWAREHALAQDFAAAVRSYRQAVRVAARARAIRLELAAALCAEGRLEDAREEVGRAQALASDWLRIPTWAGERLLQAGLFPRD